MLDQLQRWWAKKYQLPWNHNLFLERTQFDLLVEFYSDLFESQPLEMHRQADGEIQFTNTGDPYVDKWEEEIAKGKAPDLTEAFSVEELETYMRLRARTRGLASQVALKEAVDQRAAAQEREIRARHGDLVPAPSSILNTFGDGDS